MRGFMLLVFLALVAFAWAESNHGHRQHSQSYQLAEFAPQYQRGKQYIYQYNAQISTGFNEQQQNAVQQMRAQMRLTFLDDKSATVKLQQWQTARINDDVHKPISQMMPIESLQFVEIPTRHLELLEKPFEISYDKGEVKQITFDSQDRTWSENIKRAAINAFQLQLGPKDHDSATYFVNETTIEGQCQSMYTVVPESRCDTVKATENRYFDAKDQGHCVQITKSVNFDLCKERPDLRYNHYRGQKLDTSFAVDHREQHALEQSTITQAELTKNDGKYILRFARTISHQTLPLTEKHAMMAVSIGELKLKGITRAAQNATKVSQRKTPTSLMHSLEFDEMFERFVVNGDEDYTKQQNYMTELNIPDVLVNIAKHMAFHFVSSSRDEWSMDNDSIAHQITNLVSILRYAAKKDLDTTEERLFKKNSEIESMQQKSAVERLYVDALALAGTQPTIQRLLEKIKGKQLTESEAASALQKLARNVQIVGEKTLDSVWQICTKSKPGTTLQHACVLSWSCMTGIMCAQNEKHDKDRKIGDVWAQDKKSDQPRCPEELKNKFVENVRSLYDAAGGDSQQRILALKAFGNMGLDSSIRVLQNYITDQKLFRLERVVAIDALRQLVDRMPHEIRRILISVFMNKHEFPEVRMNAIHQLLRTEPDHSTISQIMMETVRETDVNIRTFVVSELYSMAMKMRKINQKTAQQILDTVQLFQRTSASKLGQTRRSNSYINTFGIDKHFLSLAALNSNDSVLPKELMMQFDAVFREHFVPAFLQLGLHQQNVEQLINKLFDRVGSQSFDEILVRSKRSTFHNFYSDPIQMIKQMMEHLPIIANQDPNAQSSLMFYKREKNMDMYLVVLDKNHMPELLKGLFLDGQMDLSVLETQGERQIKLVDVDFAFETKIKVPTIFGVPLVSTERLTKVSGLHGSFNVELDGRGKYISSGSGSLKTVPKLSMKSTKKLEAVSPLFTTGVQLQHSADAQIPLSLEAKFSSQDGFVLDLKMPERNDRIYKLLQISSHPSTLYREWPAKSRVFVESKERTLYLPKLENSLIKINKQVRCPMSQIKVDIRGHLHISKEGLYLGENVLEVHAYVNEQTAKSIRFQVRADIKSTNGKTIEAQRLMRTFEEKRHELFETSLEEVKQLKDYFKNYNVNANFLVELDAKMMALSNQKDEAPREQAQVLIKTLCDRNLKMCNQEIRSTVKGWQLTGSLDNEQSLYYVASMARPTITGLHDPIQSEHVLIHAEAYLNGNKSNDTVMLCVHGRPSNAKIQQLKDINENTHKFDLNKADFLNDDRHDGLIKKNVSARLTPNHYTFSVDYQMGSDMLTFLRPYVQYGILSTKTKLELLPWLYSASSSQEENPMSRAHGHIKTDLVIEGSRFNFQVNGVRHSKQIPSWSSYKFLSSNLDDEYDQSEWSEWSEDGHQSYNQRQASRHSESKHPVLAKCAVDSSGKMEAFNNQEYNIKISTCYITLAKDCSLSSKYTVLAKHSSKDNSTLDIKLLVPGRKFEMCQRADQIYIKMNGVRLRESEFQQNGIEKNEETSQPMYIFRCPTTFMQLHFNGHYLKIMASSPYDKCGACVRPNTVAENSFNGKHDSATFDLKASQDSDSQQEADNCTEESQEFDETKEQEYRLRSKFSGSDRFDTSDELFNREESNDNAMRKTETEGRKWNLQPQKKYSLKSDENDDESEDDSRYKVVEPIMKTKVIEKQNVICFSVDPQKGCPEGTVPILQEVGSDRSDDESSQQDSEVDFYCIERVEKKARELKQKTRKEQVVSELRTTSPNRRIVINQILKCARADLMMQTIY